MSKTLLKQLQITQNAAKLLRTATTQEKNNVLFRVADLIDQKALEILKANAKDLKKVKKETSAFIDRLTLNEKRLADITESLRAVASLPDPVNEVSETKTLRNGLVLTKIRAPLGVIFMIFESRPNVAVEAFSLAFKAGNCCILRGGKESMNTTMAFYKVMTQALKESPISPSVLWGITNPNRQWVNWLLKQRQFIDVVVPRGGDGLINFVVKNSEIPIVKNDRGLCHVFINQDADENMALKIVGNSKCHRPGVCNAMETLLVHKNICESFLPKLHEALGAQVQWYACPKTIRILKGHKNISKATEKNFHTEYLDLKMNCRVVDSFDQAVQHIEKYGSKHSESIVTASREEAKKFQAEIDAAAVYWNASTRFTDGFEFGLGGELGISTQKLHVRGPVGLRELTSLRWVIDGTGQVR